MQFSADHTVAILGSSRSAGNTRLVLDWAMNSRPVGLIDLAACDIKPFDYEHANQEDDFLPLLELLLAKPLWIVATPVYWYAMSAQMKIFYDRLSDPITIRKDMGRRLRGISVAVMANGVQPALPEGFEVPFRSTCDYLGMRYLGIHYTLFKADDGIVAGEEQRAATFGANLVSA